MKSNASHLVVEQGIPLPPTMAEVARSMKVGDSVLVPSKTQAFSVAMRRCGYKLTTRKVKGGTRFWRI